MKKIRTYVLYALFWVFFVNDTSGWAVREIVITFDDLPANPVMLNSSSTKAIEEMTSRLVSLIRNYAIPAVGFVNEKYLFLDDGNIDPNKVQILKVWVENGIELGNHTYSHSYFFKTPLRLYEADVLEGEKVTKQLLAEKQKPITFFRYPYLNTGPDIKTKMEFEDFLIEHSYVNAPVTIDSMEWFYAEIYAKAQKEHDDDGAKTIAEEYITHESVI